MINLECRSELLAVNYSDISIQAECARKEIHYEL